MESQSRFQALILARSRAPGQETIPTRRIWAAWDDNLYPSIFVASDAMQMSCGLSRVRRSYANPSSLRWSDQSMGRFANRSSRRPLSDGGCRPSTIANTMSGARLPIVGRADAIITANQKDFPEEQTLPFNVEVIHPDDFLVNAIDLDTGKALAALTRQRL